MTSEIWQNLSILVTYRLPRFFTCSRHVPRAVGRQNVASLNMGGFVPPTFYSMMEIEWWWSFGLLGGKRCVVTLESIKDFLERICLFNFALKSSSASILGSSELSPKLKSISSTKSQSEASSLFYVSSLPSLTRTFSFLGLFFSGSLSSPVTGWVCLINHRDG